MAILRATLSCRATDFSDLHFSSRFWPIEHGATYGAIQSIAQTPDGYLWLGTQSGLARFDGQQFEFLPLGTSPKKESSWINALCVGSDGILWIGSREAGLWQYRDNHFTGQSLPWATDSNVLCLHASHDGSIWCGTANGLAEVRAGQTKFPEDPALQPFVPVNPTQNHTIRSLAEDGDGNVWVGGTAGIYCVPRGSGSSNLQSRFDKPETFVRAVCSGRDGSLWIGSNSGLRWSHGGKTVRYSKSDGLPDDTVTALYEDAWGELWIGTYGGLCRLVNGKFKVEVTDEGEPYGAVLCFFEDREKNIWAGSKDGLYCLNLKKFYTIKTHQGLANNNVISVFSGAENTLWVGTWGGGLQCFKDGEISVYSKTTTPALKSDLILAIAAAKNGDLWVSTDYNGGLYRMRGDQFEHFGSKQGLLPDAIRVLLPDSSGQIWLGTAWDGIQVLHDTGEVSHYRTNNGLPSDLIRCLCQTADGSVWIGTEHGLACWTNGAFVTYSKVDGLSDNTIFSLHEDAQKNLWIGTAQGGLNRRKAGKFKSYSTGQGLFDGAIVDILEDENANLWLGSYRGVFEARKKDFDDLDGGKMDRINCMAFGKADGMSSSVCVNAAKPGACKTADGRLWFATAKGLIVTDPKLTIEKNQLVPPIVLQSMIAGKQLVSFDRTNQPAIPPDQDGLEFHYAALSYKSPEENQFRYRLSGVDADWIDAGNRRVAYYNNLRPGNYRFQVIGANGAGVWNTAGVSVAFILLPHFWQTWWFQFLAALALLVLIAGGARQNTRKRMEARLRVAEQQHAVEKERSRIAQDIHDEIGAKLTKITFLGGIARQRIAQPERAEKEIEKMSDTARELIGTLDEIVWAVDPRNDTLENFANYLCRHASEFFEDSPISCELRVPLEIAHFPLSADIRHNLFLAQKEALNNLLKHSGANKAIVELVVEAKQFKLIITDNGTGLSSKTTTPDSRKRAGNGLRNMRERLASIGGTCEMGSGHEHGTVISFTVPLSGKKRGGTS